MRSEVQKKSAENNQLGKTNIELEKNYESLNNELLIYQTKVSIKLIIFYFKNNNITLT